MSKYIAKKEKKQGDRQTPAVDSFGFGAVAEIDADYLNVASDASREETEKEKKIGKKNKNGQPGI